ncbi:MAG: hypothetical protein ACYCYK_02895, partial [Candidatus Dormibacteria bacterium]
MNHSDPASSAPPSPVRVTPGLELPCPFQPLPEGLTTVESLTLRPIVRAWAVAADHTVLVARDAAGSELGQLALPDRDYLPLAQLSLPAHRIVAAPGGWIWLRSWPALLKERATKRPFARELLVLSPSGELRTLLTLEGALVQTVVAGELVLVATSGGALHAFGPDGTR